MQGVITSASVKDERWLSRVLAALECSGFAIVENVLDRSFLIKTREAMYRAQASIVAEVGMERLNRSGEVGVLRLMMKFEPIFFAFLEVPELLQIIDATVSPTAIMHLQNGFILPSFATDGQPQIFQNSVHMDFPRVLNGFLASVNALFAIDDFTAINGATLVVPGSHQKTDPPSREVLSSMVTPVICQAGSMVVFDSTLWHAAGHNSSGQDRLAINHQFTRSYIKQQIDYVRALGETCVLRQRPRTQQLLGYYTRVVTSLDEYYRPEADRLYRKGQG